MSKRIPNNLRVNTLVHAVKCGLKILYYDIETSPMRVWTFMIGQDVTINHNQIDQESQVMCIQYMFEGDKQVQYLMWDKLKNGEFSDSKMLQKFAVDILPKAHIVVTQNGDNFDHKVLNFRLMRQRLSSLAVLPSLDTLKLSKAAFRSPSHKLDYRSQAYGLQGKKKMEMQDWIDIVKGKVSIRTKMIPYGCKDVSDDRAILWKELPYYKTLPVNVEQILKKYTMPEIFSCQVCAKKHEKSLDTHIVTETMTQVKFRCNRCNTKGVYIK